MKFLHLSIIVGICVVIVGGLVLSSMFVNKAVGSRSDDIQSINQTIDCPLHDGFTMSIGDIHLDGNIVANNTAPLTINGGEKATYNIEVKSQASNPIPLSFRFFNDEGNYRDLASARVKFAGDVSGLPEGLTVSLDKNTTILSAGGSDQITLMLESTQNIAPRTLQIGVLGNVKLSSMDDDCTQGYGTILDIPIIMK